MTIPHHSAGGDVLRHANFAWSFSTDVLVMAGTLHDVCVGRGVVLIAELPDNKSIVVIDGRIIKCAARFCT